MKITCTVRGQQNSRFQILGYVGGHQEVLAILLNLDGTLTYTDIHNLLKVEVESENLVVINNQPAPLVDFGPIT